MKKGIIVCIIILIMLMEVGLTGCLFENVKEETITGTITLLDIGGSPAIPFGVVTFDNGRVFSPLTMHAYGMLSKYLNQRVIVTFVPSQGGGWYDVEDIR